MKTKDFFRLPVTLLTLLLFLVVPRFTQAQSITYPITNNLSCIVDIAYTVTDNTCALTQSGNVSIPPSSTFSLTIAPGDDVVVAINWIDLSTCSTSAAWVNFSPTCVGPNTTMNVTNSGVGCGCTSSTLNSGPGGAQIQ